MNAIILSAGLGARLYPLTKETPKALIKVNEDTFIERQIKFLKNVGIDNITVVVGYLKNKFDFLVKHYNIKLIYNEKFDDYSNIYSLYLAKDLLDETYVLDSDVYLAENIFETNLKYTTYFSYKKENFMNEWVLYKDENNSVFDIKIETGRNKFIMSGVTFLNKKNSKFIRSELEKLYLKNKEVFKTYYWDNIILNNFKVMDKIKIVPIDGKKFFEIDTIEELDMLRRILKSDN